MLAISQIILCGSGPGKRICHYPLPCHSIIHYLCNHLQPPTPFYCREKWGGSFRSLLKSQPEINAKRWNQKCQVWARTILAHKHLKKGLLLKMQISYGITNIVIKHSAELAAELGKTFQLFLAHKKNRLCRTEYCGFLGGGVDTFFSSEEEYVQPPPKCFTLLSTSKSSSAFSRQPNLPASTAALWWEEWCRSQPCGTASLTQSAVKEVTV